MSYLRGTLRAPKETMNTADKTAYIIIAQAIITEESKRADLRDFFSEIEAELEIEDRNIRAAFLARNGGK